MSWQSFNNRENHEAQTEKAQIKNCSLFGSFELSEKLRSCLHTFNQVLSEFCRNSRWEKFHILEFQQFCS